jgi:hypothetical protein
MAFSGQSVIPARSLTVHGCIAIHVRRPAADGLAIGCNHACRLSRSAPAGGNVSLKSLPLRVCWGYLLTSKAVQSPSQAQTRVIAVALAAANPPLGFNQPVHGRFERHARRLLAEVREGEPDGIGHRPPIVATPGDLIQEKTALKPFA